jgi:hypothetical protein
LRSLQDAERIIDYGILVRIVKGQWADPSAPGLDPRRNYLDIIHRLSGRAAHVAIATHDRILANGYPSLPYDIWQARTRPAIMAWAMRDFVEGKHRELTAIR